MNTRAALGAGHRSASRSDNLECPMSKPVTMCVPEVNYSSQMLVRKVRQNGSKKWKGAKAFVSESLVGEALELQEIEDDVWDVYLWTKQRVVLAAEEY